MSTKIGIRELKNQATRILREVREETAEYIVTLRGEPVAVIRPFTNEDAENLRQVEVETELAQMKYLANQVAASWTAPKSAVELVEEQRR
ncbi:MAG: type II toxin-antitoxin system prevent-host-death family antitoxin [Anaerolineales bacterium]|nr:type II toxin-antitoxin system prevent-host-death family antitoxin [Chloroflexota bacterium]MBL7164397.1 type II toxin-antitoxin system prevent-host-death family antitoxin [Anaerolineales bacterium]